MGKELQVLCKWTDGEDKKFLYRREVRCLDCLADFVEKSEDNEQWMLAEEGGCVCPPETEVMSFDRAVAVLEASDRELYDSTLEVLARNRGAPGQK